jgi:hypothetical protein
MALGPVDDPIFVERTSTISNALKTAAATLALSDCFR